MQRSCTPNSSLPFELQEYCCNDHAARCVDMDAGCSDPYQAYTRWCDPLICYNISAKDKYMITMQAASAIGGLYGLFMLVFVSCVWRICLARCRPHWKPSPASPASAAAGEGGQQLPKTLALSPEAADSHVTAARAPGFATTVRQMSLQLVGVSSANSALSNAHAPLTPAVSSMTPVPPTPEPSGQVGTAESAVPLLDHLP